MPIIVKERTFICLGNSSIENEVNKKSRKVKGGKQIIQTPEGYLFPVQICSGLLYDYMRPAKEDDLVNLPSVVMTSPME